MLGVLCASMVETLCGGGHTARRACKKLVTTHHHAVAAAAAHDVRGVLASLQAEIGRLVDEDGRDDSHLCTRPRHKATWCSLATQRARAHTSRRARACHAAQSSASRQASAPRQARERASRGARSRGHARLRVPKVGGERCLAVIRRQIVAAAEVGLAGDECALLRGASAATRRGARRERDALTAWRASEAERAQKWRAKPAVTRPRSPTGTKTKSAPK